MALFFARVELHSATSSDYDTLHTEMARVGFSRQIKDATGVAFELPTGEYAADLAGTASGLAEVIKSAAVKTGRSYYVLVAESAWNSWSGFLKRV